MKLAGEIPAFFMEFFRRNSSKKYFFKKVLTIQILCVIL